MRIVNRNSELTATLDADIVIDLTGRASRTPVFLERLGYGRPAEEQSPTAVGYSSQRFVLPGRGIDQQLVMSNQGPRHPSVLLSACEHNTWMLAVGRSIDTGGAPDDFDEMLVGRRSSPSSHQRATARGTSVQRYGQVSQPGLGMATL